MYHKKKVYQDCYVFILNKDKKSYSVFLNKAINEKIPDKLNIPGYIDGLPVTKIGAHGFEYRYWLKSVKLPETIVIIDSYAFYFCFRLTSIKIPKSVKAISKFAFRKCFSLKSINIPNGVVKIGDCAFQSHVVKKITIPASVRYIGIVAFNSCARLSKITVDKNNKIYDSRENCNAIIETKTNKLVMGCKGSKIPKNVKYIGACAFKNVSDLKSITIPGNIISIGVRAFENCWCLKKVIIKKGLKTIEYGAFSACTNLASINMPESVIRIGKSAFFYCESLVSVKIPRNVSYMGVNPFEDCHNIASINVNSKNKLYDSRNNCNAIIETKTNKLIVGCKNTTIPNNVEAIGELAFSGCEHLKSLILPESLVTINDEAFFFCKSLTSIKIPRNVSMIGVNPFFKCNKLVSIVVDNRNKKYDSRDNCNAIIETKNNRLISGCNKTIIPKTIKYIGEIALYDTISNSMIEIPKNIISVEKEGLGSFDSNKNIVIPKNVKRYVLGSESICRLCCKNKNLNIFANNDNGVRNYSKQIYFYKKQKPIKKGNYWHYVNKKPQIW